jgi:hypothetical protein
MKKSRLKLIILEVCFFLLASAYIPFGMFGDAYISKHINSPCDSFGVGVGEPCVYTPLAAWFNYVLHIRNDSVLLDTLTAGSSRAQFIAAKITMGTKADNLVGNLIIIGFWMAVLNLAYFDGRRLMRVLAPRAEVKSKQPPVNSRNGS